MDIYFLAILILFALAAFDLVVGVANDAVNFINSAIGARVASRKVILAAASIGVIVGAMFSSGMMEIAKSGVFSPDKLTFQDIIVIFLAVLITDVILLDAYNTFGLPTSTTVSLVFELLGAAVVVAIWKILGSDGQISELASYINTAKALAIITGIFTSVWISFTVGTVVQFFSRMLFSFEYERRFKWIGAAWCGLAFASMTYYLFIKGLKGASIVPSDFANYVNEHGAISFLILMASGTVIAQVLIWLGVNVLRWIVLYGTASLAMAFAGNDLVNFIGPSVAALDAYRAWMVSGVAADQFTMESLKEPVPTNPLILAVAGLVMVATLLFSRKARTVTETEIGLTRSDSAVERFKPNSMSRFIVHVSRRGGAVLERVIPAQWMAAVESNFMRSAVKSSHDGPAFDLIRATVNLTTASSLIAIGTALKLPLSTTYVTFLIAMGTSLSDRAWGRETAVYRIAGVMNVIGGWFLTALVAFLAAAFFGTLIYFTGAFGVVVSLGLALYAILHNLRLHSKRERGFEQAKQVMQSNTIEMEQVIQESIGEAIHLLQEARRCYVAALQGFVEENGNSLRQIRNQLKELEFQTEQQRIALIHRVAHCKPSELANNRRILKVFDLGHDILLSMRDMVKRISNHVLNSHLPPNSHQAVMLRSLAKAMDRYLEDGINWMTDSAATSASSFRQHKLELYQLIEQLIEEHIHGPNSESSTSRNAESISRILMEAKDLVAISARLLKHFDKRVKPLQVPPQEDNLQI